MVMAGCVALVVAAGRGRRFGGEVPKQYLDIGGLPVLRHAVLSFLDHPEVDAVCPVIDPGDRAHFDAATAGLDLMDPVAGGAERQESVRLGLESLVRLDPERVLIHDAARPLVSARIISAILAALERAVGAVPALPVGDTLKRGAGGMIDGTVERHGLWRVQTPQGFRYAEILAAHREFAGRHLTDDAAVAEEAGLPVALVEGAEENLKVTTVDDLRRAEEILGAAPVMRTGIGFDVHRFGPGDRVVLCGVEIPFERCLEGHSDADVGLHALCDALMGAVAAGDIGSHFPPDDPRWTDTPSETFLRRAGELVAERRGTISGVDLVVICERPKIAPHRAAMVARIADILGIAPGLVSVKGTTTEGLGFAGRGEGIAAQAVASVRLPSGPANS